jgi:hypothetical protein
VLKPTKHSHPDATVVAVAAELLKSLRKKRIVPFDQLRQIVRETHKGADVLLLPALDLLFILGTISYRPKVDAVEYSGL